MPIEPIEVHLKGVKDRNEKDNSETGYHFGLSLGETLPYQIKDMVVQDIEVNKTRGDSSNFNGGSSQCGNLRGVFALALLLKFWKLVGSKNHFPFLRSYW
jgi:hypothetical protein